jgi:nitrogen fixation protein NifB
MSREIQEIADSHPCYNAKAHNRIARVHLPVAPLCNISCNFCDRRVSPFYHTSRPGLSYEILRHHDVNKTIEKAFEQYPNLEVVGISGPGEPLYNEETFHSLRLVGEHFPDMKKCVCTNGLLLPQKVLELKELDVKSITVTINAVDPVISSKINSHIIFEGETISGLEGAKILIDNQLEGVKMASDLGFLVKVNCVLIPGLNMDHVRDIAYEVEKRGAHIFNIMPIIPLGRFSDMEAPSCDDLIMARESSESIIPIFRACKQCRADSCGVPGQEGDRNIV